MSIADIAKEIASAYSQIYLYFYRRRDPRGYRPSPESLAVMEHLFSTGPLTVSEASRHLDRSQSSVSELLERLVKRGLLTRIHDERDRRRTLVWLSRVGLTLLEEERRVLDHARLEQVLVSMSSEQRKNLRDGLSALIAAAGRAAVSETTQKRRKR